LQQSWWRSESGKVGQGRGIHCIRYQSMETVASFVPCCPQALHLLVSQIGHPINQYLPSSLQPSKHLRCSWVPFLIGNFLLTQPPSFCIAPAAETEGAKRLLPALASSLAYGNLQRWRQETGAGPGAVKVPGAPTVRLEELYRLGEAEVSGTRAAALNRWQRAAVMQVDLRQCNTW
jgi:hypothetical protein